MKALIKYGKRKGQTAKVSQWGNDWFTLKDSCKVYSPTSLAFKPSAILVIKFHKNNEVLFNKFKVETYPKNETYCLTFKKRYV